ncbi:hypothetical protein JCM17823_02510 [Halorubrum gandharaense]
MSERTAEAAMTVEEDGVRVEKSFTDDEFPVPAVTYDLSSSREEAARVRIVDSIPESFPMDRVGFHPDYESENWTAYKDHRVEFERVLEPGEEVRTVFGIRSDDPDLDGFLSTPVIEHVPVGEEIEDVLGEDSDAVREVLSGDRTTLPGMEEAAEDAETADIGDIDVAEEADEGDGADEPAAPESVEPRELATTTTAAVTRRSGATDEEVAVEENAEAETGAGADEEEAPEPDTERAPAATTAAPPEGGVAAALAAEVRAGEAAEEDLELLRESLGEGVPRSVDVRISRLQSSVADMEAYTDALEAFLDEEGTAEEVLSGLQDRLDDVESEVDALVDRADSAATEREELDERVGGVQDALVGVEETVMRVERSVGDVEETVDDVEGTVEGVVDDVASVESEMTGLDEALDDLSDDVSTLYDELESTAASLEDTDERVADTEATLDTYDAEFGDIWDDLAEVDTRLTAVEEDLGDDLGDVEAEIEAIHDQLEELDAFRERLNEAFGP